MLRLGEDREFNLRIGRVVVIRLHEREQNAHFIAFCFFVLDKKTKKDIIKAKLYQKGIEDMDIRDITYFLEIAEYENISKAAAELHISQPPLSRQLKKLEEELGVELFSRDNGRLRLTEAGYFFKQRAQEVMSLVEKTKSQIDENYNGVSGKIRIGTIETLSAEKLPKWIAEFHEIYPEITYQIVNNNSDEIIHMVDKGLLDIGIVREPVNSLYYERIRLQEDSWIAYIPNRNPLSQKNRTTIEMDLSELKDEWLIVPSRGSHEKQIKTWFEMQGVKPKVVCWYSSLVNGMALVKNGLGIMLCPKSAQSILDYSCATVKEIVNPAMTTGSVIVWKNFHNLSESARKFIDFIKAKEAKEDTEPI